MTEVWYFGADWCTACYRMQPLVEQACKEHGVRYSYLDVDEPANKETAEQFGFRTIPAVVVLTSDGNPGGARTIAYRAAGRLINRPALEAAFRRANGQG